MSGQSTIPPGGRGGSPNPQPSLSAAVPPLLGSGRGAAPSFSSGTSPALHLARRQEVDRLAALALSRTFDPNGILNKIKRNLGPGRVQVGATLGTPLSLINSRAVPIHGRNFSPTMSQQNQSALSLAGRGGPLPAGRGQASAFAGRGDPIPAGRGQTPAPAGRGGTPPAGRGQ